MCSEVQGCTRVWKCERYCLISKNLATDERVRAADPQWPMLTGFARLLSSRRNLARYLRRNQPDPREQFGYSHLQRMSATTAVLQAPKANGPVDRADARQVD